MVSVVSGYIDQILAVCRKLTVGINNARLCRDNRPEILAVRIHQHNFSLFIAVLFKSLAIQARRVIEASERYTTAVGRKTSMVDFTGAVACECTTLAAIKASSINSKMIRLIGTSAKSQCQKRDQKKLV